MNVHVSGHNAHAVYAPSSAHRWTNCSASAEAIASLGDQEEGEAAAEGTAAHEEIERVLGPLNTVPDVGGGDFVAHVNDVDREHDAAYGVSLVVNFAKQLATNSKGGRFWVEQRIHLTEHIWGRCDVAHWDDATSTLTIVDYKNGQRAVDADENEQLRIYGAGSIYTHKLPAKWVRYVVVQPNDWRPFVPRVKQWVESADALYAWANKIAAIPLGKLEFTAGEHCRDCPLFGKCDASLDMLSNFGAVIAGLVSPEQVRPEQIALFMALEKPITDQIKKAKTVWEKAALKGNIPPGMKLVRTTKHRTWKDEDAARVAILAAHGPDALAVPTPAQVEKLGGVDVETISEKPEGGPALAFESDKRALWEPPSAEKMFGSVVAQRT